MSVLAIDAGTTGVTALVVTAAGKIAARGYQEFAQHFPKPGWVEHSPEEIWQATIEATRDALAANERAAATTSRRSGSPTSARRCCCGTGRRWAPPVARSCGRTVVRRTSARACAKPATRSASPS